MCFRSFGIGDVLRAVGDEGVYSEPLSFYVPAWPSLSPPSCRWVPSMCPAVAGRRVGMRGPETSRPLQASQKEFALPIMKSSETSNPLWSVLWVENAHARDGRLAASRLDC